MEPTTQTVEASEARRQWGTILDQVFRKQTRVIVQRGGVPIAAVVSTEDLDQLDKLRARRTAEERELDAALASARAAFADVPEERLLAEVGEVIARLRAARRAGPQPPSPE